MVKYKMTEYGSDRTDKKNSLQFGGYSNFSKQLNYSFLRPIPLKNLHTYFLW